MVEVSHEPGTDKGVTISRLCCCQATPFGVVQAAKSIANRPTRVSLAAFLPVIGV
jgi:hypothetical protein